MADEGTEAVEAVVFRDDQGELYAVPCALLEQLKVPEDQRDAMRRELEEAEDDDVSGFGMTGFNFTGYRTPIKIQPRPRIRQPDGRRQLLERRTPDRRPRNRPQVTP